MMSNAIKVIGTVAAMGPHGWPSLIGDSCTRERCSLVRQRCSVHRNFWERSFTQSTGLRFTNGSRRGSDLLEMNTARMCVLKIRMGGGPRTYPGGVKKWQWKRQQRKDARLLERARRSRERKLVVTRRRQNLSRDSGGTAGTFVKSDQESASDWLSRDSFGYSRRLLGPSNDFGGERLDMDLEELQAHPKNQQGGWTGRRSEVEEQIQKVRERMIEKDKRPTGPVDDGASSFSQFCPSSLTRKALNYVLDIRKMTQVQETTLPLILEGWDLLAQTDLHGEDTIASLILGIELILKRAHDHLPLSEIARMQLMTVSGRHHVMAVLVCPTQDSVSFVASNAKCLATFHRNVRVQVVTGANDYRKEAQRLQNCPCEILVATPGRLLHHLQQSAELRGQFAGLKLFAIHEGQRLIDMGYERTIESISRFLPRTRQTLLWSPSQSYEILALSRVLLRRDHKIVTLSGPGGEDVNCQMARQHYIIVSLKSHLTRICTLLKDHAAKVPDFKVIVFCQTVRAANLMAEIFEHIGFRTRELHARKNEKQKELVLAEFRATQGGMILFTSGSSVWRAAFPDVTLVLQIGSPGGKQQYVERVTLSRQETRKLDSVLLLMPHEMSFLGDLSRISLQEMDSSTSNRDIEAQVQRAVCQVSSQVKTKAYVAWLRYHIAKKLPSTDPAEVLQLANTYSTALGFREPPRLNSKTKKALHLNVGG